MGVHVHIGTMVLVEVAVVGVKRERRRRPNWLLQVALKCRLRHTDFRGLGLSVRLFVGCQSIYLEMSRTAKKILGIAALLGNSCC